jgi:hypothetical protein
LTTNALAFTNDERSRYLRPSQTGKEMTLMLNARAKQQRIISAALAQ